MNNKELIADFLNKVVTGDSDAAKEAFSLYCNNKAKAIGHSANITENFEQFKTALILEFGNVEQEPLRMEGDKIFVNNKIVGHVKVDMDDFDSGIDFVSVEGDFSKEFHTAEELFAFLSQKYLGEQNVQ